MRKIVSLLIICVFSECFPQQTIDVLVAINQPADCEPLGLSEEWSPVYPNPASDILNIPSEVQSFTLIDTSGKEYHLPFNDEDHSIDTRVLAEGIYFLHLFMKDGYKAWKVKIERR